MTTSHSRTKKLMRVSVKTHPNGYSLDIECQKEGGFMYHDLQSLLRGFMVHIGMGITDQLDMDEIETFVQASLQCSDVVKTKKRIDRLETDLKVRTGQRNSMAASVVAERGHYLKLADEIWKLREEFKGNKEVSARLFDIVNGTQLLRPLTLADLIKSKDIKECEDEKVEV